MTPESFLRQYTQALGSQLWRQVAPLIHADACVTFSTGTVHKGKTAVQEAFENNFSAIEGEHYEISNVHWALRSDQVAVCLFDFNWAGRIEDREASGGGKGTSVLVRNGSSWQLLVEHLSPRGSS
ncbi:MAG: nuclear transport factor 2 family protein [Planctomycetales bacterium]|nr:nuclear transport factor 2 family protein [Planctomycetales bacterium]